jgi:hypothetical protein
MTHGEYFRGIFSSHAKTLIFATLVTPRSFFLYVGGILLSIYMCFRLVVTSHVRFSLVLKECKKIENFRTELPVLKMKSYYGGIAKLDAMYLSAEVDAQIRVTVSSSE